MPQSNQIHHSGQVNFADLQYVENLAVSKVAKNISDMNNLFKKILAKEIAWGFVWFEMTEKITIIMQL